MKNIKLILEDISDFFVYDIYHHLIRDNYYNVKWYIKNLGTFQEMIWEWRPWDYQFQIDLFIFGMEHLRDAIVNGNEVRETANKKIAAIDELIKELQRDVDDEAWKAFKANNLTYEEKNELYRKLRDEKFARVFRILKGQDISEFQKSDDAGDSDEDPDGWKQDPDGWKQYTKVFDGTGIEGWWD